MHVTCIKKSSTFRTLSNCCTLLVQQVKCSSGAWEPWVSFVFLYPVCHSAAGQTGSRPESRGRLSPAPRRGLAGPEGDLGTEGLLEAGPRLLPSPWAVSRFACPMSTGRNCAGPRPRRRLERGPVLFGVRGRVPRRQRRLTQGAPASAIWGPRGTQGPGPRRCLGSPGVVMF